MKKCPKCKRKTLETARKAMQRATKGIQSLGEYIGAMPWKTADA